MRPPALDLIYDGYQWPCLADGCGTAMVTADPPPDPQLCPDHRTTDPAGVNR